MHQLITIAVGGLLLLGPAAARAQCLSLPQLLALSASAPAAANRDTASRQLPSSEWAFRGLVANTSDLYWTSTEPGAAPDQPAAWLSLRPDQLTRDVVLKTSNGGCVRRLRRELEQLRLRAEVVNCSDCEGERYQAGPYNVTIYSARKDGYPFVVVLRQPYTPPPPPPTSNTTQAPARSGNP